MIPKRVPQLSLCTILSSNCDFICTHHHLFSPKKKKSRRCCFFCPEGAATCLGRERRSIHRERREEIALEARDGLGQCIIVVRLHILVWGLCYLRRASMWLTMLRSRGIDRGVRRHNKHIFLLWLTAHVLCATCVLYLRDCMQRYTRGKQQQKTNKTPEASLGRPARDPTRPPPPSLTQARPPGARPPIASLVCFLPYWPLLILR